MKNNLCLLFSALFVFIFCGVSHAQLIYTFAGNGTAGYTGNGGSPTGAELNAPASVAIDGSGNIYIADNNNNVIRKVSISSIISTVVGNNTAGFGGDEGDATSAMLHTPAGIAVDGSGNIYIADMGNFRVRKVNPSGMIHTIAGNGIVGYTGDGGAAITASLGAPVGIAIDDTGSIYIADSSNNVIRKIDTFGNISTIAGTGVSGYSGDGAAATTAKLYHPTSITIDAAHNIYIADNGNNVIRKINTSGEISTFAGNGTAGFSGDSGPAISAQLNAPYGIVFDDMGNAYITDQNNNRLREVNNSGNISTVAGIGSAGYTGDGGAASAATLNAPAGLVIDNNDNKYIADYANNAVRVVSSDNAPSFVNGSSQTMTLCESSTKNIDTFIQINDADYGQTETWTIISGPEHGIMGGIPYTATSNGGTIMPTGITYTPNAGYSGIDILTFQVSDGIASNVTTIDVTINPMPYIATLSDQVVCNASLTAAVNFSDTVSGITYYTWTNDNSSIGLAASGTGNIASFMAANTSSLTVTATVIVTPSTSSCIGLPQDFSITVNPTPDVTALSDQVLCNGATTAAVNFSSNVSGTTYTWTNSNSSIGLATTGTGDIASFIAANTSATAQTATVTVTPSANGCTGIPQDFAITVNPSPNVVAPSGQVFCNGVATGDMDFTSNVSGATYTWANSNSSIGLASTGTGDIASFTAANTSATAQTATVTVTASANGCTGSPQNFNITVNQTPIITALSNQVLCNGAATGVVSFSGSGTTYTWTNSNSSIGLATTGTGDIASFTAANTSATAQTATVTVTPSANGCTGTPQDFAITVNPSPNVVAPSGQVFCNGVATGDVDFTSNVSGATYMWTNSNSSIGLATTGTGDIASFTAANTSATAQTATITVTASANGCTGAPQNFSIIVNQTPNVTALSSSVFCDGMATGIVSFSGSGTTYTWTNSNSSIGLASTGTGDIASFMAANISATAQTATVTVTPSANGCTGTPQDFAITVNPSPNVVAPSGQVFCNGVATGDLNFSSNVTGAAYTWTNSNSSIGLSTTGTGDISSFTAANTSATAQTATVTVTASANGCTGAPQNFSIIVNQTPNVAALSSSVFCNGMATGVVSFSGNGTTYTWTNSNSSIGLASTGTGDIASFMAANISATAQTATVTVTPSANGCTGTPQDFAITVNPSPNVVAPSGQVFCNGVATGDLNFSSNVTGAAYTWTNSNSSIGLSTTGTGDISSFTAANTSATAQTATVTVTASANGCTGAPQNFSIIVNQTPNVAALSSSVFCNGMATGVVSFSGSGTTYTWTNSNSSIGLATTGTGDIASFMAANISATAQTATVTVTPSANGCTGTPQDFAITVNPSPNVVAPSGQVFCNGVVTSDVDFSGSGTTYTWVNNNSSIGLATTGTGDIASFTAANTSATAQTATVTVTPSANGCTGTPQDFAITVNPSPNVVAPSGQVFCNGVATGDVDFTSNVSGATYMWTNSNSSIGLATTGTGDITSFTAANTSATAQTATITVTASANGCTGAPQNFSIIVNQTPNVTALSSSVFCNGMATGVVSFSGNGTTYTWTNSNSSIGLASTGTGDIASFMAANISATAQTATVTVTPSANGCTGTPQDFAITVNPSPNVVAPSGQVFCNGVATGDVDFTSNVSGATYMWTNSNSSIGLATTGTGDIASFTAANTSATAQTATVTVTASANGCTGIPQGFTITVNQTPTMASPANQLACSGAMIGVINFNSAISGISYNWTNNNTGIGLAASDTGNIASFTATNATPSPVTATVNVTPAANGCTGIPVSFMITVNPGPVLSSAVVMSPICDSTVFIYMPTSATSGTTFTWGRDPVAGISNQGASGIDSVHEVLVNTTPNAIMVIYADTLTANGCTNIEDVTVLVNPKPMLSSTVMPPAMCSNTLFSYIPTSATAGTTFTWSRDLMNGISSTATSGTGSINEVLINTTPDPIVETYTGVLTANGCVNTENITVTVNPTPTLSSILTPPSICDNSMFSYKPSSVTVGTTFAWSRAEVTGISNLYASGSGNINEVLENTTTNQVAVAYVDTIKANGCINIENIVVAVNPTPMLSSTLTPPAICNNTLFSYTSSSKTTGTEYTWGRAIVSGISDPAASGTGNINETLTNTTNSPIAVIYADTLVINGCINTQYITVTVNPTPTLNSTLTPVGICSNTLFSYIPESNVSGATFTWDRPYVPGIDIVAGNGVGNVSEVLVNTTNFNVNVTYIYAVSAYGCSASQNVVVTVHPNPLLASANIDSVCSGITFNYTPASFTPGTTFTWMQVQANGITPATATGTDNINATLINSLAVPVTVTYVYVLTAYGCADTQSISVLVNAPTAAPVISMAAPSPICVNTLSQNFGAATLPPAGVNYVWSAANASVSTVGSTQQYALINFTTPGTAIITLTAITAGSGCQSQAMDTIDVESSVADAPADVIYFSSQFICLQNDETGYQWGYDNASTYSPTTLTGEINQNYQNDTPDFNQDNYWVLVSHNGCRQKAYYNKPDGAAQRTTMTTVNIYPNPASEKVSIEIVTTEAGIVEVEVLNLLGQKMNAATALNNKADIDVSGMPSGCYLVNCSRNGVIISSAKFVKN